VHLVPVAAVVLVVVCVVSAAIAAVLVTRKAARALRTGYRSVHTQISERAAATLTTLPARVLPSGPPRRWPSFEVGGVLVDWDPRHLYRKVLSDPERMETFLTQMCTPAWHA
jgi:hypothetical protein